jgi:hypothetical protein
VCVVWLSAVQSRREPHCVAFRAQGLGARHPIPPPPTTTAPIKPSTHTATQILKRINAVITQRIAAGEALPPPPRTAIAGPEYFGLNDAATQVGWVGLGWVGWVCWLAVVACGGWLDAGWLDATSSHTHTHSHTHTDTATSITPRRRCVRMSLSCPAHPEQAAIEALDPEGLCGTYWQGKRQR